jgi:hypothetical protein
MLERASIFYNKISCIDDSIIPNEVEKTAVNGTAVQMV